MPDKMYMNKIIRNLDIVAAFGGFILGITLLFLYLLYSPTIYLISIGLSLFLACIVYLLLKYSNFSSFESGAENKTEKLTFEILFFILFIITIYILHHSVSRTLIYFILISICIGFLSVSISIATTKIEKILQIMKIFLISFSLKYSIYLSVGGFPGVDIWRHAQSNELLSLTGNINVLFDKEKYFPIMHIQTSIMQILTNSSIKDATNFAIIIPFVILSICVYLSIKNIFGEKVGLLAALILNITDYHIYWGSAPQTTSYGVMLYYTILYVLLKAYTSRNKKIVWTFISLVLIFTLIFTHAVSSFVFLVTIIGLFIGSIISKRLFNMKEVFSLGGITLITVIALIQYWFVALYSDEGKPFFDTILLSLMRYMGYADVLNRPESVPEYFAYLPPFIERFANNIGFSILLFFAIIGGLLWLSSRYNSKLSNSLLVSIVILLGINFSFPFFGIRNIMPNRWFAFEYFSLSIMAAYSLKYICFLIKKEQVRKLFIFLVLINISFFMSVDTVSNDSNPLWLKGSTISTSYTLTEVKSAETLSKYSTNLFSDGSYGSSVLSVYLDIDNSTFKSEEDIFRKTGKIFIWRNYMLNRPIKSFMTLKGYYKQVPENKILGYTFLDKLNQENKIYQSNDVSAYYIYESKRLS